MNANPSVPYLEDAAFDVGQNDAFQDEKNGIRICIETKAGRSHRIPVAR